MQINRLMQEYQDAIKPYVDRLVRIEEIRTRPILLRTSEVSSALINQIRIANEN